MCIYVGLGYFIPNLGQLFNLQGAVTGVFLAFIFPIGFYLKVFGHKINAKEKTFYLILMSVGVVGGSISAVTALNALLFGKGDVI